MAKKEKSRFEKYFQQRIAVDIVCSRNNSNLNDIMEVDDADRSKFFHPKTYYIVCVNVYGVEVMRKHDTGMPTDKARLLIGNYFDTEKEAEDFAQLIREYLKMSHEREILSKERDKRIRWRCLTAYGYGGLMPAGFNIRMIKGNENNAFLTHESAQKAAECITIMMAFRVGWQVAEAMYEAITRGVYDMPEEEQIKALQEISKELNFQNHNEI